MHVRLLHDKRHLESQDIGTLAANPFSIFNLILFLVLFRFDGSISLRLASLIQFYCIPVLQRNDNNSSNNCEQKIHNIHIVLQPTQ